MLVLVSGVDGLVGKCVVWWILFVRFMVNDDGVFIVVSMGILVMDVFWMSLNEVCLEICRIVFCNGSCFFVYCVVLVYVFV